MIVACASKGIEVDGARCTRGGRCTIDQLLQSLFFSSFLSIQEKQSPPTSKPSYLLPHTVFPFFIILPSSPSPCHHMICFPFFSEYFRCFFYPSFFLTSLTSFGGLVFNRLHLFHNEFLICFLLSSSCKYGLHQNTSLFKFNQSHVSNLDTPQ